jgi:rhamnosyltransferase subunit B
MFTQGSRPAITAYHKAETDTLRAPRIVLATLGSLGDLHPFIALALALKGRGADVLLACAAEYRIKVEGAGLAFAAMRPSFEDMENALGMDRAQMTDAVLARGDFLFRKLVVPSVRVAYEDMVELCAGADMVVTSSLCIGARLAAERRAIPCMAIVLQPLLFMSAFDPPVIPKAEWLTKLLRALGPKVTGVALSIVKFAVGRLLLPVQALRREIGLEPSSVNPVFEGQFSAAGAIGLYSTLLGAVRPDYPRPTVVVGFAHFDSVDGAVAVLDPALEEFLAAGCAPLVFTLGSLVVNSPGTFYRESVAAARRLGRRAVLLVGETGVANSARLGGTDVHVCAYAPHSLLFPRGDVIVHQGGIGTLAQALRSGRPQLIVPFYGDQEDNAARAVALGCARALQPNAYVAVTAARELALLTGRADYELRAAAVREHLAGEDGAVRAAQVILDRLESSASQHGASP